MSVVPPVRHDRTLARRSHLDLHSVGLELDTRDDVVGTRSTFVLDWTGAGPCDVDFAGESVTSVLVDGLAQEVRWVDALVSVPLPPGRHEVVVEGTVRPTSSASGLHVHHDDAGRHLHTHFEPAHARHVFPCFEDPAVRAPVQVTVSHHGGDAVLGGMPVSESSPERTVFAASPPLPSYLVAFAVGPWKGRRRTYDGLELGVFTRRAKAPDVELDVVLEQLAQGVAYFSDVLRSPFPYPKLDVAFVPGARYCMENAGLITMGESGIPPGGAPPAVFRIRTEVLLHEVAHMWFGDVLGIRWWDDLWLKEAFATRAGNRAADHLLDAAGDATRFATFYRRGALQQDASVWSHAIRQPIADTDACADAVDGITYGKGAAALEQLERTAGSDVLTAAIAALIAEEPHRAVDVGDLLPLLPADLGPTWDREWLRSMGVMTVRCAYSDDGVEISAEGGPPQLVHTSDGTLVRLSPGSVVRLSAEHPLCIVDASAAGHLRQLLGPSELAAWGRLRELDATARAVAWTHLEQTVRHGSLDAAGTLAAVRATSLVGESAVTAELVLTIATAALLRWCPAGQLAAESELTLEWLLAEIETEGHPVRDSAVLLATRITSEPLALQASSASRHGEVPAARAADPAPVWALFCDPETPIETLRTAGAHGLHREHDDALAPLIADGSVEAVLRAADDPVGTERLLALLAVLPPTTTAVDALDTWIAGDRAERVRRHLRQRRDDLAHEASLRAMTLLTESGRAAR